MKIFSRQPSWQSKVALLIATLLTCCNLGVTLRFFVEMYFLKQPSLSVNWTPFYCFIVGILLTPVAIRFVNSIELLDVWSRRALTAFNLLAFFSLISPIVYDSFRDYLL